MWQIAAPSGRLQPGHQFWHTDDVDYPPEIVGEHMKTHLGPNIQQSFHDEVRRTHAVLDRGIGMFHDHLAPCALRRRIASGGIDKLTIQSKQIFDISMAEIKAMIEPYSILNDFRRKSVTLVHRGWSFHPTITLYHQLTCQYRTVSKHDFRGSERPLWGKAVIRVSMR